MGRAKKETDSQPADEVNQSDSEDLSSEATAKPARKSGSSAKSAAKSVAKSSAKSSAKATASSSAKTPAKAPAKRTRTKVRSSKRSPAESPPTEQPTDRPNVSESATTQTPAITPDTTTWKLTEDLIKTLNQELGGLKEYVLADLRGEITTLRSRKLQLQTEINQLQTEREQYQKRRGQIDSQADGLQELAGLREQVVELKQALEAATQTAQQALGSHESDLSDRLTRMQALEHQGEVLLGALIQRLQQLETVSFSTADGEADMNAGMSPIASVLGASSTVGIAASLRSRTEEPTLDLFPSAQVSSQSSMNAASNLASTERNTPQTAMHQAEAQSQPDEIRRDLGPETIPSPSDTEPPETRTSATRAANVTRAAHVNAEETLTLSEFPADALFGRAAPPPTPEGATAPPPRKTQEPESPARPIPPFDPPQSNPFEPARNTTFRNPYAARENDSSGTERDPEHDESFDFESSHEEVEDFSSDEDEENAPILGLDGEEVYADESRPTYPSKGNPLGLSSQFRSPSFLQGLSGPGLISAGLSLLLMAFQYCTLHIIFRGAPWLGASPDGLLVPSWTSALLTFWIRMLMVLPFMIVIGQGIYPPLLEEMQELMRSRDSRPLISIVISSFFLFLSQFFLYYAVGISSASVALGLFFLYPLGVSLLGWGLLKRPLGQSQLLACLPMGLGGLILLAQGGNSINPAFWAAVCFSLYVLLGRAYTHRIHTLTLTVMQFGFAWLFSMPALFFLREMEPRNDVGYVVACLVLSLTVFLSYFFNTASLNRLGPGLSRLINGWTPLLVALISLILALHRPSLAQGLGLLLITLGLTALNLERLDTNH